MGTCWTTTSEYISIPMMAYMYLGGRAGVWEGVVVRVRGEGG